MDVLVQAAFEEPYDPTSLDHEPLVIHRRTAERHNYGLLIFVHGLGGRRYGSKGTWGQFPRFVYDDFPMLDVGLYAYRTLFGRLKFWESVPLDKEARVLAEIIRDAKD